MLSLSTNDMGMTDVTVYPSDTTNSLKKKLLEDSISKLEHIKIVTPSVAQTSSTVLRFTLIKKDIK